MGVFKIFSASTGDGYERNSSIEPDPHNFEITKYWHKNGHVAVMINYPNCINYEGNKICVYKNCTARELKRKKTLDPHFTENGLSPIARFEPTDTGWLLACELLKHL